MHLVAKVLVVSDGVHEGTREDRAGPKVVQRLNDAGWAVIDHLVTADGIDEVAFSLRDMVAGFTGVVLTTGGTGLTPNDVTPEATRSVIQREAPGFAEQMRAEGLKHTPHGLLTRGVSGIAGRSLIVNFPGSPKSIDQLFPVLAPTLKHVVRTLGGDSSHHESDRAD